MCTVRTPRNQVARTLRVQCPGRARCYAHNRLVVRACALGRARCCAQLRLPRLDPKPRSCTKWPNRSGQVATSSPGHDLKKVDPGRDLKAGSRLRFLCQASGQVATSFPGCDLLDDHARSRRQPYVATSLFSQPKQTMSRPQNGVATPMASVPLATSNLKSLSTSRSQLQFLVVTSCSTKPGRDLKTRSRPHANSTRLRPQIEVTTSFGPNSQRPLFFFSRNSAKSYPAKPGRYSKNLVKTLGKSDQVTTSNRCRDLTWSSLFFWSQPN